jgi:hypothetical protein
MALDRNGIPGGIVMRKLFWTVFLFVAFHGMATASTAFASPTEEKATLSVADSSVARLDGGAAKAQPGLRADGIRKPERVQSQVLSKNFANPKPVQIYWFFGGR